MAAFRRNPKIHDGIGEAASLWVQRLQDDLLCPTGPLGVDPFQFFRLEANLKHRVALAVAVWILAGAPRGSSGLIHGYLLW